MKKIIIFVLIILTICLSYLYNLRDTSIRLFRVVSNEFVNLNDLFCITIYSNVPKSEFTSYDINIKVSDVDTKLKKIDVDKYESYYKISYYVENYKFNGLYNDMKLQIEASNQKRETILGNLYFASIKCQNINSTTKYSRFSNLESIKFEKELDIYKVNGKEVNRKCDEYIFDTTYYNINYVFECNGFNYLISNKDFNKYYLEEF